MAATSRPVHVAVEAEQVAPRRNAIVVSAYKRRADHQHSHSRTADRANRHAAAVALAVLSDLPGLRLCLPVLLVTKLVCRLGLVRAGI